MSVASRERERQRAEKYGRSKAHRHADKYKFDALDVVPPELLLASVATFAQNERMPMETKERRKLKITRDEARYEIKAPELIEREMVDKRRWDVTSEITFSRDGAFWRGAYDEPATECQEGQEYDDFVECDEVFPVQKTVTVYE